MALFSLADMRHWGWVWPSVLCRRSRFSGVRAHSALLAFGRGHGEHGNCLSVLQTQ